jgi:ribonuclease-3
MMNNNTLKKTKNDEIINKQIEEDIKNNDFTQCHCSREELENLVGFRIKNTQLYLQALTHKSIKKAVKKYPYQNKIQSYLNGHNERLEFLGDRILTSIIGEYLYTKFPNEDEGFLTKLKIKLENGKQLADFSTELNLNKYILTSTHIKNIQGKTAIAMLENAFEALIGAIHLDLGWECAKVFVINVIERTCNWRELLKEDNYKDVLLRWCQKNKQTEPEYKVLSISGPGHNKRFEIGLFIDNKHYSTYSAPSKKIAEQHTAKIALNKLNVKF